MSVTSELNSEVAAALLLSQQSSTNREELLNVLLVVHATLRQLSHETRRRRFKNRHDVAPAIYKMAVSGQN